MQKKIFKSILLTSMVAIVLTATLLLAGVYALLESSTISNLKNDCAMMAGGINYYGNEEYIASPLFNAGSYRVTFIDQNGEVTYDNKAKNLGNHSDRPEFIEAMEKGTGSAKRYSGTLEETTYYYAMKLDNDTILRISDTKSSILGVFFQMIPMLLGILILVIVASYVIGRKTTKGLVEPIESLSGNLEHYNSITLCGYEELVPFINKINGQREEIKGQIHDLKRDRDTIRTITENMKEGLILIDKDKNILSINRSAIHILDIKGDDFIGKNLIAATRNETVNTCAVLALKDALLDSAIESGGKHYQVHGCSVKNMGQSMGAILLLVDVTSEQMANNMRKEFTANVSHELKTPLTSISGYAEMMANGLVSPKNMKEFSEKIYKECGRLMLLIQDILTLSKLDEAYHQSFSETVNVYEVAEAVIESLKGEAEKADVSIFLTKEPADAGPMVLTNSSVSMVNQLLYNLISNGIKYNKIQGAIHVTVKESPQGLQLSIADTGIGIPEVDKERIFERFYRVDKSRSKNGGGTGLGLSIVKHILKSLGGTIQMDSVEGKGTTVTVELKK